MSSVVPQHLAHLIKAVVGEKSAFQILVALESTIEEFVRPAAIVTNEQKFAVVSYIAEFWCTISSPLLALPILILFFAETQVSPTLALAINMSALTAVASTLYHATNWEGLSVLDCACALATFTLCILNSMHVGFGGIWGEYELHLGILFVIVFLYGIFWRVADSLTPLLFALIGPVAMYTLYIRELWITMVSLGLAGSCFAMDRHMKCRSHTLWHMFSGLALFTMMHDALAGSV